MTCEGCDFELQFAYELQEQGLHVATTKDRPSSYPNTKKHFAVMMVDDNGKIVIW